MDMDALSDDQIFCSFLDDDEEESLEYTVPHPFVYVQESDDDDNSCNCPHCHPNDGELYYCSLCDREDMTKSAAEHHLSEPSHRQKMEEAAAQRGSIMSTVERWREVHNKMKRLHDDTSALPDGVLAAAFRCVKTECTKDRRRIMKKATRLLHKYETLERLALLHLAVWKAECLSQMPALTFLAAKEWMSSGWKSHKSEHGKSGAMHTILSLVLPFVK